MTTPNSYEITQVNVNKLLQCIQNGNVPYIKQFLGAHHVHWSTIHYDKTGDNLLHYASKLNLVDVIDHLLTNFHPKVVDCRNNDDKTPLHEAAQFGNYEACMKLLEHGADVNALRRADWTPIMLACTKLNQNRNTRIKIVKIFLEKGALINFTNKDGWSCIHLIAREGDVDILNLLIENGADVTLTTKNGRSALHIAALHGQKQIVDLLLNLNINAPDKCGNTPLHEAVLGNNVEICKALIASGADITSRNNSDYGLLHLAASEGTMDSLEWLSRELKWNVNESNKDGITGLHCAARKNKSSAYEFLLKNGADETVKDRFQRIPSDYFRK